MLFSVFFGILSNMVWYWNHCWCFIFLSFRFLFSVHRNAKCHWFSEYYHDLVQTIMIIWLKQCVVVRIHFSLFLSVFSVTKRRPCNLFLMQVCIQIAKICYFSVCYWSCFCFYLKARHNSVFRLPTALRLNLRSFIFLFRFWFCAFNSFLSL